MQYYKISTGKFIEYDETTERATILVKAELVTRKQQLVEIIATANPNEPKTNAEWIAYGKAQYPYINHSAQQEELSKINVQLEAIKLL